MRDDLDQTLGFELAQRFAHGNAADFQFQRDGVLAKLFTGQRTDWAKAFQQTGDQMLQSSIKSMAQQGLSKLGKEFGVDVGAKAEVFSLLGDLVERGIAIVMVSSDMLEILGLSDRILVMRERAIVGELSRADASEEEIAYLSAGGSRRQDVA